MRNLLLTLIAILVVSGCKKDPISEGSDFEQAAWNEKMMVEQAPTSIPRLSPQQIVDKAVVEARKAGAPGTTEFTVNLRRNIALLSGQQEFADLAPRPIEMDLAFQVNLARSLRRGKDQREDLYIFRGAQVTTSEFDNAVAVIDSSNSVACSGFAIAPRKIVTSGHCVDDAEKIVEANVVSLGVPTRGVAGRAKFSAADVGLLFLEGDVSTAILDPLADSAEIDAAKDLQVVGFGKDENGSKGRKARADVIIATHRCDRPDDMTRYGCMAPFELVADSKQHQSDTCAGDSGGPAFINDSQSAVRKVAAIVKGGVRGRDCEQGSIYVRLDGSDIASWLQSASPSP
jgi:V8-like Glu-specific endopeptidase